MGDVNDIADTELIRRAIVAMSGKRRGRQRQPLWASVGDLFCLGSTYSAQLCRKFGFDPDMEVRK